MFPAMVGDDDWAVLRSLTEVENAHLKPSCYVEKDTRPESYLPVDFFFFLLLKADRFLLQHYHYSNRSEGSQIYIIAGDW